MDPKIYKPSIYKGAGIYKAGAEGGGGGGGGDLPEGYTPAIYARTNGAAVSLTFTGLQANINDKFVLEVALKLTEQYRSFGFVAYASGSKFAYPYVPSIDLSGSFMPGYHYNTGSTAASQWATYNNNSLIKVTSSKKKCKFDLNGYHEEVNVLGALYDDTILDGITLFKYRLSGQDYNFDGIIYSLKVYDKDNPDKLNADFVPCYDGNNVLGFYEKISGQFQGSANLVE